MTALIHHHAGFINDKNIIPACLSSVASLDVLQIHEMMHNTEAERAHIIHAE